MGAVPLIVQETLEVTCTRIETVSMAKRPSDSSLSVSGTSTFPSWDSGIVTEHHTKEEVEG